jgi:enoyl-CoA hydratase
MPELVCQRDGSTLILTLNRPEKMNALSAGLVDALLDRVGNAAAVGVRLLVLRGEGRNFSAGFDFSGFEAQSEGDLVLRFIRIEQLLQALYHAPFETVALAQGKNFGAGVDMICSCSHRVADGAATFRMPGLSFGLVLGTRRFAERVGNTRARHVLQEGRTFDTVAGIASGFLTETRAVADWPEVIARLGTMSTGLSVDAVSGLSATTSTDTRAHDLADLACSAAAPGLKERIRTYTS